MRSLHTPTTLEALSGWLTTVDTLPAACVDTSVTDAPGTRGILAVHLVAWTACWTRGARRERARGAPSPERPTQPLLAVALVPGQTLDIHWTYGLDRVHYDSLVAHLAGRLAETPPHPRT